MARGSYQNHFPGSPSRGGVREAREEDDNMTAALRFDTVFACCAFAFVGAILIGLL
jgi:hypothetical protein